MTPTQDSLGGIGAAVREDSRYSEEGAWLEPQPGRVQTALRVAAATLTVGVLGRLLVDGLLFLEQLARFVAGNFGG